MSLCELARCVVDATRAEHHYETGVPARYVVAASVRAEHHGAVTPARCALAVRAHGAEASPHFRKRP